MIIAETPRLIIRPWELNDLRDLCVLTREEGFGERSFKGYTNFSLEKAEAWINYEIERFGRKRLGKFAMHSKEHSRIIGIAGIFEMPAPDETRVEINYRLPTNLRGKGFAKEATLAVLDYGFRELKFDSIDAVTEPDNEPSKALLSKIGMKKIGPMTYGNVLWDRWRIERP